MDIPPQIKILAYTHSKYIKHDAVPPILARQTFYLIPAYTIAELFINQ
jgi:hypothetical protein